MSNYSKLYDILIDKNNFWRKLNDMVDFSFVYEELKEKYSSTMGRKVGDVIRMFKYLLLKEDERFTTLPAIKEEIDMLEETMMDTEVKLEYSKDQDTKIGHKTADTSFFGYKTHIAMTPERIITASIITSGEKHDGKQMQKLIEKSQNNGIEVEAVIGDGAYSEKGNIEFCEKKIKKEQI